MNRSRFVPSLLSAMNRNCPAMEPGSARRGAVARLGGRRVVDVERQVIARDLGVEIAGRGDITIRLDADAAGGCVQQVVVGDGKAPVVPGT